ncbi:hypothetical protein AB0C88_44070 [Streptomyces chartreusis]|uniref:hypothetical protein n=1 Tax=Streptomyces chartreusis TaxID=1969 RepID=UPI0033CCA168
MSEKNDRPKPPARRTGGRPLGGAKKTTPPPPPPTAELTPEQFAAEQATTRVTAPSSEQALQVDSVVSPETVAAAAVSDPVAADTSPVADALVSRAASEAPEGQRSGAGEPASGPSPAAVDGPVSPGYQQGEQPVVQEPFTVDVPSADPAAEVAVRRATSTAFPVQGTQLGPGYGHGTRPGEAASDETPWAQGPGRPGDLPNVAVVLNQRVITRESFDSSVPAALKLKRRIKRFALDNELDHLPIGDIVAVAMDEWLTARGF